MNRNPYEPPTSTESTQTTRRSRRPYWIASTLVVICLATTAVLIFLRTHLEIIDGEIYFSLPDKVITTTISEDPIIAYDRILIMNVPGAIGLGLTLVVLSLAAVNGIIFISRRFNNR